MWLSRRALAQEVVDLVVVGGDDFGEHLAQQCGFVGGELGAAQHELGEPLAALCLPHPGALAGIGCPSAVVLRHRVSSSMQGRLRRSLRTRAE